MERKLKSSPLCRRLVHKLREVGLSLPYPDTDYALEGHSPGRHQKAAGQASWELYARVNGRWHSTHIGGDSPATVMVKKGAALSCDPDRMDTIISLESTP